MSYKPTYHHLPIEAYAFHLRSSGIIALFFRMANGLGTTGLNSAANATECRAETNFSSPKSIEIPLDLSIY